MFQNDSMPHACENKICSEIASLSLKRLKYDKETINAVCELIENNSFLNFCDNCSIKISLKRLIQKIGEKRILQLLEMITADVFAQTECAKSIKLPILKAIKSTLDEIQKTKQCFSLKDLSINGNDLIKLGYQEGIIIGRLLNWILELVIDEQVNNSREELIKIASKYKQNISPNILPENT
jgi:tRNA nucleotidyltransferase (CCA-adding enzyme)